MFVVLNLLLKNSKMLNVITFVITGCASSVYMVERVNQAISDVGLDGSVNHKVINIQHNLDLARRYDIKDGPTVYCEETRQTICGLWNPVYVRNWLRSQLKEVAYGTD